MTSGNRRWTRTLPIGPPRSTSRNWFSSSLALGIDVVADISDRLPFDTPYYHDRAKCRPPSYFQPHGGPITHSFTGSKPDSPIHPSSQGCSSRVASYVIHGPPSQVIYFGSRRNTQSHCSGPLSHVVSDIEQWPIRLKLLMVPSYFTLDIFLSTIRELLPTPFPELCTR